MDCCRTKNDDGCCKDLGKKGNKNFFGFLKRKNKEVKNERYG